MSRIFTCKKILLIDGLGLWCAIYSESLVYFRDTDRIGRPTFRYARSSRRGFFPLTRGTLSLSFSVLATLLLRVGEIHVFLSLLGRHAAPQSAGGARYHGDRFLRLLAA